jgi:hypothetical protein
VRSCHPQNFGTAYCAFTGDFGVNPWSGAYNPLNYFTSTLSREAVSADYIASRAEVAALMGEDSGSVWLAAAEPKTVSDTLASTR